MSENQNNFQVTSVLVRGVATCSNLGAQLTSKLEKVGVWNPQFSYLRLKKLVHKCATWALGSNAPACHSEWNFSKLTVLKPWGAANDTINVSNKTNKYFMFQLWNPGNEWYSVSQMNYFYSFATVWLRQICTPLDMLILGTKMHFLINISALHD